LVYIYSVFRRKWFQMKKQIAGVLVVGIAAMAALLAWANAAGPTGELLARILVAVLVVGLLVSVQLVKRAHQNRTLVHSEGSVEKEMALKAQSAAYIDALVIMVLALTVVAISGSSPVALVVIVSAIALLVVSFWVRYLVAKRRVLAGAGHEEPHS
jgi:ABC-type multidrug transport system fused ATPase/permease subunit